MANKTLRWTRVALGVSLALNLAVAGVVVGALARGGRPDAHVPSAQFNPIFHALSAADRRALGRELRDQGVGPRVLREDMRRLNADIAAAIVSDPFEPATLAQALLALETQSGQRRATAQTALIARIGAMPLEARKTLAKRMLSPRRPNDKARPEKRDRD
jgi:uncharacterized membrane protein